MPVYRCSHVLTPQGLGDGAVAIRDGSIVAVGPLHELKRDRADEAVLDLGDSILMPGLVNAHTHLELSWVGRRRPPGGDYLRWLQDLLERRAEVDPEEARREAEAARESLVSRGTVAVGDICNETWVADVWKDAPVRGVLFHELLGLATDGLAAFEAATALLGAHPAPAGWRWSVTPHAPHTTSVDLMRRTAETAARERRPLSIHLAESEEERALLAAGDGPFRAFFERREFLPAGFEPARRTPFEQIEAAGLLGPNLLAVHAVGIDGGEITRLAAAGATVVSCPRSNAYLGVGVAPVPALVAAGVNLALGTDSLATTDDLDLFAEMEALAHAHPGLSPRVVVDAATTGGARALGLDDRLGSIETGKAAQLIVVPYEGGGDPWEYLCSCPSRVRTLATAPHEVLG